MDSEPKKLPGAAHAGAVYGELPFDKIYNFRDVGETVNKHSSGRYACCYVSGRDNG